MGGCFSVSMSCDQMVNQVTQWLRLKEIYIHNLSQNIASLEKAVGVLKAKRDDVQGRVNREEFTGHRQRLAQVQVWLTSILAIENQFNDLLSTSKLELGRLCLCGFCSNNVRMSYLYGKKVVLMLREVESLISQGEFDVVTEAAPIAEVEELPTQPTIVGQETTLERVWKRLTEDKVGIVGLHGMGGVGKTTLLTQINNRFSKTGVRFDVVLWVVVSKNATVHKIQGDIAKKLGLGGKEWDEKNENERALEIHNVLRRKRFVLLLDDIWEKVNLNVIGVPYPSGENGCKVAFTTRSRDVCGRMGVNDPIEVTCLDPDKAWDLFKKKVGENTLESHPDIPELARKVAAKCRGLPLALNVIGETMACKSTVQEWHRAIEVLTSSASEFSGVEDEILPILKYSYDSLKDEQVKSCFLYCSLFPGYHRFDKERLIEYWICEGFIDEMEGRERALNQGYEILGTLVRASLLEVDRDTHVTYPSYLKIHDVVREMGLWIASDLGKHKERCIVQADSGVREIPKMKNWKDVRRMSLMGTSIEKISESLDCPELTTLLLGFNRFLTTISGEFFRSMPRLLVLDLQWNVNFSELPEHISGLSSLRSLDLSRTQIERLPVDFQELKMLIHLNLENTNLASFDANISKLSSLRTLKLRGSNVWLDMSLMKELQLLEHLEFVSVNISSSLVGKLLLYDPRVGRCIQHISVEGRPEESVQVFVLPAMDTLAKISIWNCGMREIKIEKTPWNKSLLCFSNLTDVQIGGCDGLKDLTWLLLAPNLISLYVLKSRQLEEIISKEKAASVLEACNDTLVPFQKLEAFYLYDLPELKSIYWTALPLPRLNYLDVFGNCQKLRKFPLYSKSVLKVEDFSINHTGGEEWIQGIEWEDEATRDRFLPLCRFSVSVSTDQVLKNVSQFLCFRESYIHSLEENLEAIQKDMEELKARQADVWRRVEREEDTGGHQRLPEVKVWLKNVDSVGRQVSYLLGNRTTDLERFPLSGLCFESLRSNYSYGERVSLMSKKLNDLKSKGDFQVVVEPTTMATKEERLYRSRPTIVGRETVLGMALNHLMSGGPGIMGLYGVGGVGKSTILREINNKVSGRFDFVIWVVVTKHLCIKKIQEEIGEKLGFHGEEWNQKEESQKANEIHNFMKKKRFVLLLDDVWTQIDLTKIGVPFPTRENKCKIAFTTRSREVCVQMGVDDPIEVQRLSEKDAWDLFQMKIGEHTSESRLKIRELARKVAEKCHGVPLALNVLGATMSCKTTVQEWNNAVDVLTLYATEFSGTEDILPILKYSYDNLRVAELKSCFQYIALFPPAFRLSKDGLIECWESEGFIGGHDQGHEIINKLVGACLLMEDDDNDKFVKMHDLAREMALWVVSDFGKQKEICIVQAGLGLREVPRVKDWSTVRRMSLMSNEIEEISDSHECPHLTTLLLQQNRSLRHISGEFFRFMPKLAVLNMSFNQLKELPKQMLDLLSLQYLNLSRTDIERLPDGLGRLKRLKHLNLEMTERLKCIDGIRDVSSLLVLRLLHSKFSLDVSTIEELQRLEQLESLNIDISSSSALEELFNAHELACCITEVCIRDVKEDAYKTLVLPTMERLSKLIIRSCEICEIEIGRTPWDIILTRARLKNLTSVIITGCNGLKELTWLLLVPNLTHLELQSLEKVQEIISEEKAASSPTDEPKARGMHTPFLKLERLNLINLPKLKRIYWRPLLFPCLKKIEVEKCPKLRKLPLKSESCVGGEEIVINYRDDQWFKRVRWEDEASKDRFLPCCEKLLPSYSQS